MTFSSSSAKLNITVAKNYAISEVFLSDNHKRTIMGRERHFRRDYDVIPLDYQK
jgi:hypothetical protein